ncbi:uncharacterized protein LOC6578290 [Drosophila mojavensis]|nr:uncharacterized protein LOC6578290 [Drosophila mojavensis]
MKCITNSTISILIFIAALSVNSINCHAPPQSVMRIEMDPVGMHRKLKYTIEFAEAIANLNCEYMIAQQLPAAVYISTDELDDLQRFKMLNAKYPKFVDVEIITEKAKPFSVLLRGSTKIKDPIQLPIHFRYHAASRTTTLAKVKLGAPQLYISCTNDDKQLIDKALLEEYDKFYCLDESATDFVEQTEKEKCNWQRLHMELSIDKPLIAEIPKGDANAYVPVLCATLIISWGATVWIMLTTRKAAKRINKQIAEEELQEEKLE